MPPHHKHDDGAQGPESTGSFVRRLLRRLKGAGTKDAQGAAQDDALPPPGQRSGTGAASAEKYLQDERNSRPTPLE
jgi:hypothetical protein